MKKLLARWLGMPGAADLDLDAAQTISTHRAIIIQKPFLKNLYLDFYGQFEEQTRSLAALPGSVLELGSGGGFLKDVLPAAITSDVCPGPLIDRVASADRLPFGVGELKAIFCLNVLHHLAQPDLFFAEAQRTLLTGGRIVMIEPYNSIWGRFFYKHLHHEPFDETVKSWTMPEQGRLSTSNQAIPWIIFHRDRALFESKFPALRIIDLRPHTALRYALSGGMSFRAFVPAFSFPFFTLLDRTLSTFGSFFPIFETIVLEKR